MQSVNEDKILAEYQEKADAIIQNMLQIVTRAQRKVDSDAYRKILEKLDRKKQ